MIKKIVSITGTRADYGLMVPVYRAIAASDAFALDLIVTGMHLLPEFASSLAQVRADRLGTLHDVKMLRNEDSEEAMARSVGQAIVGISEVLRDLKPHIVLLQGDRSEMLAGAVAAAHMNIPIVHMSGGDYSGSIDDSVRNAISKLAHIHLTSCDLSTQRLIAMGEVRERIAEIGEPALDLLRTMELLPFEPLAAELGLERDAPFLLATLHPVTDEADASATQMTIVLEALAELGLRTVFTYPNTDHGGRAMRDVLESWRGRPFLRIEPSLGSRRYFTLMRHAAAMVGNSSSGIIESPSFRLPAINIGTRQFGRLRANNVIDVAVDKKAIVDAVNVALRDTEFRNKLASCQNPYGDGHAAERTIDILRRLRIGPELITKWKIPTYSFVAASADVD